MPTSYDADRDVQASEWLSLDPSERLRAILAYHVQTRATGKRSKWHALQHGDVENRLASGHRPTQDALDRLRAMGLGRHDALHRIAALLWRMERTRPLGPDRNRDESGYQQRLSEALRSIDAG